LESVLDGADSTAQQKIDAVTELNRMDSADDRRKRRAAKKKAAQPDRPRPAATEAAAAQLMAELNEEFPEPKKPLEDAKKNALEPLGGPTTVRTASSTAENVLGHSSEDPAPNTVQPEPAPIPPACKVVICLEPATHELGQHGRFCHRHYLEGVRKGMDVIRPVDPTPQVTSVSWQSIYGADVHSENFEDSARIWRQQDAEEDAERARLIRIIESQRAKESF
jgi:hypothetical protein